MLLERLLTTSGSRDPSIVTGHGAGFVMCFRSGVQWDIHQDDDPKKFMAVSCGEYVLAIPDYSQQARQISRGSGQDSESISSSSSTLSQNAMFKKVVMKLSGNVRWLAGLVFERDRDQGGRSFEFIPHYDVTFKTPEHAKSSNGIVSTVSVLSIYSLKVDNLGIRRFSRIPKPVHSSLTGSCCACR